MPTIDTSWRSPNYSLRRQPIAMLVLHATAGNLTPSLRWLCDPDSNVSAHYVIAKDGRTFQLVPDDRVAWHAGQARWGLITNVNERSLGIELVNANDGRDPYPEAQLAAAAELCRSKIDAYRIPLNNVVRHLDVARPAGRKDDPAGLDWPAFIRRLVPDALARPAEWGTLYDYHAEWGIPTAWRKRARELGAAIGPETYARHGESTRAVQHFAHGIVVYKDGKATAIVYRDIGL